MPASDHLSLLAAALLVALPARAQSNNGLMDIAVRSGIDTAENGKRERDPAYAQDMARHANIYLIASVSPHPSVGALVREVDAIAIEKELNRLLQAQGFHPMEPNQKPDIIITVEYGRGWLPNPYSDDEGGKMHNNLTNSDPVMPPWHLNEIFFSLAGEMKRQRADEEKLIIQVKAWRYTPDPKVKPLLLWMTTMYVDDPDHRDLNQIYQKLLAAGAPHFDRPIDRQREVVISNQVPEGHVKVGTPVVVSEPKSK